MDKQSAKQLLLLGGVLLGGSSVGSLLTLFAAPIGVWGLILVAASYLAIAGTGALFLTNISLTGLFTVMTIRRPWPVLWHPYIHPMKQSGPWAAGLLIIWVGAIALSASLALISRSLTLRGVCSQHRTTQFLLSWICGLCIGRLLTVSFG